MRYNAEPRLDERGWPDRRNLWAHHPETAPNRFDMQMGYRLRPPTTRPGKRPENYLRILDPQETSYGSGVGYMQPTAMGFTRGEDRQALLAMPGARELTQAVAFDYAHDPQNALNAAKAIKR